MAKIRWPASEVSVLVGLPLIQQQGAAQATLGFRGRVRLQVHIQLLDPAAPYCEFRPRIGVWDLKTPMPVQRETLWMKGLWRDEAEVWKGIWDCVLDCLNMMIQDEVSSTAYQKDPKRAHDLQALELRVRRSGRRWLQLFVSPLQEIAPPNLLEILGQPEEEDEDEERGLRYFLENP